VHRQAVTANHAAMIGNICQMFQKALPLTQYIYSKTSGFQFAFQFAVIGPMLHRPNWPTLSRYRHITSKPSLDGFRQKIFLSFKTPTQAFENELLIGPAIL
jgi:hypothetical protein